MLLVTRLMALPPVATLAGLVGLLAIFLAAVAGLLFTELVL